MLAARASTPVNAPAIATEAAIQNHAHTRVRGRARAAHSFKFMETTLPSREDFAGPRLCRRNPSPAIMANTRRPRPPRDHFGGYRSSACDRNGVVIGKWCPAWLVRRQARRAGLRLDF